MVSHTHRSIDITPQVLLKAYWDEEKCPSIDCPIGDLFGCGFGPTDFRSLMQGRIDGRFYSYWPMPFANSARLEVVNEGSEQIELEAERTRLEDDLHRELEARESVLRRLMLEAEECAVRSCSPRTNSQTSC